MKDSEVDLEVATALATLKERAIAEAYKTVLDGILDMVAPKPSNENVSLAVKRVVNERNQWKEIADHLYNCAIGGTTDAEWNKAFAEYKSANAGRPMLPND